MASIEFAVLDFIQAHWRTGWADVLIPFISSLGNGGVIWILLTLALLVIPKTRKAGCTLAVGLILDVLCCNVFLKPLVGRIRPCDVNTAVNLLIARPTDFSFPSGHTASSFTAVSALYCSGNKLWIPSAVLAVLIAFSRLYLYVHYPSDVLAGVMLGLMFGTVGAIWTKILWKKRISSE